MHTQTHSIPVKKRQKYSSTDKGNLFKKNSAEVILNDERLNTFSLWSEVRQRCTLSLLFNVVLKVLVR